MLTQFAFIVFALFGLLALVVDVGYARLTQAQMQNAADTAALEGLRRRDIGVLNPATGQVVNDAFASDCQRRAAANRIARLVFDDDLDAANGDPDYQFGAGPVVERTGGVTNLHALDTIGTPEVHVYKPNLQLNQRNQIDGDMVSGRFCYVEDPGPSEDPAHIDTIVCTEPQNAGGAYARNDFNPNPVSPLPPASLPSCPSPDAEPPDPWPLAGTGSLASVDDSAFLVRLRRSNELTGFADQTDVDTASSGPPVPLMFARGTTIHGDDPALAYSPRRDELTVRATAIAAVRPALHVGLPQPAAGQPGVTPFALADTFVATLTGASVQVTLNPATGIICSGLTCNGLPGQPVIGRIVDNLTNPNRTASLGISTVGQPLPPAAAVACGAIAPMVGYGPVYSAMSSGVVRVIGFTRIVLGPDPARLANPCAKVTSRGATAVAAANATALLAGGLPLEPDVQPSEIRQLVDRNLARNGSINYGPVLVPVLVR